MCVFFNDTATTEIYTLSLHDALPIFALIRGRAGAQAWSRSAWRTLVAQRLARAAALLRNRAARCGLQGVLALVIQNHPHRDRKSTRLTSSHANISYAVFCLQKKKTIP